MNRATLLVLGVVTLTGCGGNENPASAPDEAEQAEPLTTLLVEEGVGSSGRETYEGFCASCHGSGLGGAPVTGNPGDWEGRSKLWQAVLMEHANAGYLEMPAKGGAGKLSDLSVSYAVEYMMLATFPDKLPDQ
jgi:cytochrome c5